MPGEHTAATCPQNPVLAFITQAITRIDSHTERQAIAMENIVEQGAELRSLRTISDKNTSDIEEAFSAIRKINKRNDIRDGADIADARWQKIIFWCLEKLSVPILMTACFFWWLGDKFHWVTRITELWKEFKG